MEEVRAEGDGVVVGDAARVLETEDGVGDELGGPGPIGGLRPGGRLGKARIVAPEEAGEERVGGVFVSDSGEAQFGDEAILEGAKEALNAALGLGTGGRHPVDSELLEEASHLGRGAGALELFVERPARRAGRPKDPMAIRIGGQGEAWAEGELAEEVEVAGGRFLLVEPAGEDLAGGIVDGGMEDEARAAVLEPGMMAAVELDEHPFLGHALTARAMLGWPPPARAGDASLV